MSKKQKHKRRPRQVFLSDDEASSLTDIRIALVKWCYPRGIEHSTFPPTTTTAVIFCMTVLKWDTSWGSEIRCGMLRGELRGASPRFTIVELPELGVSGPFRSQEVLVETDSMDDFLLRFEALMRMGRYNATLP